MAFIRKIFERKVATGIVAAAVVMLGTFWLGNQPTLYILEEQKLERVPDFFLEGVTSKTYNRQGALEQTVTAQTTNHYIEQKTELLNPNIERMNNGIISVAKAERGTIVDASQSFSLSGNASITRLKENIETARINADQITYDDPKQMILGQGNSELITPQGKTVSNSITFDLLRDTATLNGGVTGHYDVSQP